MKLYKNAKDPKHKIKGDFLLFKLGEKNYLILSIKNTNNGYVCEKLTSVGDAEFRHLSASGMTPLGGALHLASEIINDKERVSSKGYRPTILLVSDGMPNDNWESEFDSFVNGKRTGKCERWAIAIGSDADRNMLTRFINNPINHVFEANMANEISSYFNFVTMSTSTRAASVNPNESLKIEELKEVMEDEMPEFNFDL